MKTRDERGLGKQIKRILPSGMFRLATVAFNHSMRIVPYRVKYGIGGALRRHHAPYRLLSDNDIVVQVGSARDVVFAGRSRAIHLARAVPRGRVIVIEADAANCDALRRVIEKNGISNISVVGCGAWDSRATLEFLSSANHPAANLVAEVKQLPESVRSKRKYNSQLIEVDTIDSILERLNVGTPKLVSITTNGSEMRILRGMRDIIGNGCEYISLASTGDGFIEEMAALGYEYIVRDDRGYCFQKKGQVGVGAR
jgi:FkbM family methyltransferase